MERLEQELEAPFPHRLAYGVKTNRINGYLNGVYTQYPRYRQALDNDYRGKTYDDDDLRKLGAGDEDEWTTVQKNNQANVAAMKKLLTAMANDPTTTATQKARLVSQLQSAGVTVTGNPAPAPRSQTMMTSTTSMAAQRPIATSGLGGGNQPQLSTSSWMTPATGQMTFGSNQPPHLGGGALPTLTGAGDNMYHDDSAALPASRLPVGYNTSAFSIPGQTNLPDNVYGTGPNLQPTWHGLPGAAPAPGLMPQTAHMQPTALVPQPAHMQQHALAPQPAQMQAHAQGGAPQMFRCDFTHPNGMPCGGQFPSLRGLQTHRTREHNRLPGPNAQGRYECPRCNKTFGRVDNLRAHLASH